MIDKTLANGFIETLTQLDASLVLQAFDDTDAKRRSLSAVGYKLTQRWDQLNDQGAGVFVQINGGSGRGKKAITSLRACFLDLDSPDAVFQLKRIHSLVSQGRLPAPGWVTQSSPLRCERGPKQQHRRYHVYWWLLRTSADAQRVAVWQQVQAELAELFNGDGCVTNSDRVMRLPGSRHNKSPESPHVVQGKLVSNVRVDLDTFAGQVKELWYEQSKQKSAGGIGKRVATQPQVGALAQADGVGVDRHVAAEEGAEVEGHGLAQDGAGAVGRPGAPAHDRGAVSSRAGGYRDAGAGGVHPVSRVGVGGSAVDLIVTGYELPQWLPEGDRTQHLVALAGSLVGQGYGSQYVKERLRAEAAQRLPEGHAPVSAQAWASEIDTAVERFIHERDGGLGRGVPGADAGGVFGLSVDHAEVDEPGAAAPDDSAADGWFGDAEVTRTATGLEWFMDRFVQVLVRDNMRVVDRQRLGEDYWMSAQVFKAKYIHVTQRREDKKGVEKIVQVTDLWLRSPARLVADGMVYDPGEVPGELVKQSDGSVSINIYNPPRFEVALVVAEIRERIAPVMDQIKRMFPDDGVRSAWLDWMAFQIQFPAERLQWLPFLVSRVRGTGKGWIIETVLQALVGSWNFKKATARQFVSDGFNQYLAGSVVVMLDELRMDPLTREAFQSQVTSNVEMINRKYGTMGMERVFCNFVATANHSEAAAIDPDDRRFWVVRIPDSARDGLTDSALVRYLTIEWARDPANVGALYQVLMARRISIKPDAPPILAATEAAKREAIEAAKSVAVKMLEERFETHTTPFDKALIKLLDLITWCKINDLRIHQGELAETLTRLGAVKLRLDLRSVERPPGLVDQPMVWCLRDVETWETAHAESQLKELIR